MLVGAGVLVALESINNNDDNGVDQSISGGEGNISTVKRVAAEQDEITPVSAAPPSPVGNHPNTEIVVDSSLLPVRYYRERHRAVSVFLAEVGIMVDSDISCTDLLDTAKSKFSLAPALRSFSVPVRRAECNAHVMPRETKRASAASTRQGKDFGNNANDEDATNKGASRPAEVPVSCLR